ncbi:MAG: MFS transporter [Pseudomonadales bacterium]
MPWYHGWTVVFAGLVFQAVSFGVALYCFTFYVEPWSREFNVGRGEIMVIFFILQGAMGVLAPFAGRAMDRLPIRLLVCIGAISLALALVLAARATDLRQLMLIYGSLVVGGTLLAGPLAAQTLTARWFNRRRGFALGVSTVGTSLGGFFLPPLVTWLQAELGWRGANDMLAVGVVLAIVPLSWLVIRNAPSVEEGIVERPLSGSAVASAAGYSTPARAWTVGAVFREPTFWFMVVAFSLFSLVNGGLQQNLAPFGLDHGIDARQTAWVMSAMAFVMAVWKVVIGALTDRVEVRFIFVFSIGALLAAMLLMSTSLSFFEFGIVGLLLGVASAAHLPLLAAIVSRHFGTASFGLVMGLIGPFSTLSATGPWIAGELRDASGSYHAALLTFAVLLLPALISRLLLH